jgi:hypothetical protein|tara:strand:+ start:6082 stop:6828 length:747 start_codon:yes stop_codon:yes gene_type:complete
MMMKSKIKSLLILMIIAMASSCSKRTPSPLQYKKQGDNRFAVSNKLLKGEAPLNFASLQKYILKPKCMSCHSGADAKPKNDPIDFSSYKAMMKKREISLFNFTKQDAKRSRFYKSLVHIDVKKRMPLEANQLSEKELNFVQDWISNCAKEMTVSQTPVNCNLGSDNNDDDDWDDWDDDLEKQDFGNDWVNGNDWVGWKEGGNDSFEEDFGNDWITGNDWVGWKKRDNPSLKEDFGNDWINAKDWVGWR